MSGEPIVILLVEDDPAHAEIIGRNFEDFHIETRLLRVADGEAALDYLYRRNGFCDPAISPRPGLILLDLHLPKVDGLQVLEIIKADPGLRAIPAIVLTTSNGDRDVAEAYARHANSYLVKPVNFTKFTQLMEAFCQYWLTWNQSPLDLPEGEPAETSP